MIKRLNHFRKFGHLESRHRDICILIKADKKGDNRSQEHSNQNIWNFRVDFFQANHDDHGGDAKCQGGKVGKIHCRLADPHHGFIVMGCLVHIDPKKFRKLGRGNNNGRSIGETINNRMGKKIHHQAELENSERKLENADNQGKDDGIGNEFRTAGRGQGFKRCR